MNRRPTNSLRRRALLRFLAASPLLASPSWLALAAEPRQPAKTSDFGVIIEGPEDAVDVFDFEAVARKSLPPAHFDFMAWGADGGATMQANREGLARIGIRARRLVDVTQVVTSTELFGQRLKTPIILAPTGAEKAFHPEGAIAVAKAARSRAYLQILSTV